METNNMRKTFLCQCPYRLYVLDMKNTVIGYSGVKNDCQNVNKRDYVCVI